MLLFSEWIMFSLEYCVLKNNRAKKMGVPYNFDSKTILYIFTHIFICFVLQVVLKASSLNSNDVFVLRNGSSCLVWCGKGSTGDEREMAKKIASSLTKSEFGVVYEGNRI